LKSQSVRNVATTNHTINANFNNSLTTLSRVSNCGYSSVTPALCK